MSISDGIFRIDTPENVAIGYDVAGIGSRFLAALLDTIALVLLDSLIFLAGMAAIAALAAFNVRPDISSTASDYWILAAITLVIFLVLGGYYIFFEALWNGQTPGKRWVGLRVIRADGTAITPMDAVIRNLIRLVDLLPAYYGIGVVTMFIDKQSRRLGDLAAGTLVVRMRSAVSLEALTARPAILTAASELPPSAGQVVPVERIPSELLAAGEDFLRRKAQLSNAAPIAQSLLAAMYQAMDVAMAAESSGNSADRIAGLIALSREKSNSSPTKTPGG